MSRVMTGFAGYMGQTLAFVSGLNHVLDMNVLVS